MHLSLLTFDLGGTLIQPSPTVGESYAAVLQAHGFAADADRINAAFPAALQQWTHDADPRHSPRDERAIWQRVARAALAEESLPDAAFDAVFSDLFEAYATGERWALLPDALPVLRNLHRRGFRMAVISNSDSRMRRVLADLGLDHFFEALFLSGEIGFEKPDPKLFAHVARVFELPPERILHVGDSVRHDAQGAEASGWRHLLIKPGERTLATLPAVL